MAFSVPKVPLNPNQPTTLDHCVFVQLHCSVYYLILHFLIVKKPLQHHHHLGVVLL